MDVSAAVGFALVHSLWQLAALGFAALGVLCVLPAAAATARYAVCGGAMCAMTLAPVATFILVRGGAGGDNVATSHVLPNGLLPWLPLVAIVWSTIALGLQGRVLLQWVRAHRISTYGVVPVPAWMHATVRDYSRTLGLRRTVRAFESSRVDVPMVVGWLSPVILIPGSAMLGLTQDHLRAIVAHELAHVRRHDAVFNIVQIVWESLFFYHPAVWWLSKQLRHERECCCDDLALTLVGGRAPYVRALATLEELRHPDIQPSLASNGGSLVKRISRIADPNPSRTRRSLSLPVAALVTAVAVSPLVGFGCHTERPQAPMGQSDAAVAELQAADAAAKAEFEHALHVVHEELQSGKLESDGVKSRIHEILGEDHPVLRRHEVSPRLSKEAEREAAMIHEQLLAGKITKEQAHVQLKKLHVEGGDSEAVIDLHRETGQ